MFVLNLNLMTFFIFADLPCPAVYPNYVICIFAYFKDTLLASVSLNQDSIPIVDVSSNLHYMFHLLCVF